jgi:hypothetical protein
MTPIESRLSFLVNTFRPVMGPNAASNTVSYARHYSRPHNAVIRVYDDTDNVIETQEHKGEFKEW